MSCFLVITCLPNSAQANGVSCRKVLEKSLFTPKDFAPVVSGKIGGRASQWQRFIENLLARKTPEELKEISQIFLNTEAIGWFGRQTNSLLFWRIQNIFKVIEQFGRVGKKNLSSIEKWNDLTLVEKRALLLEVFQKWWWEVDSHQVMGFSKFADLSYWLSRAVQGQIPQPALNLRLHELLGDASQVGFFSGLFNRFATELSILRSIENNQASKERLIDLLKQRLLFLEGLKESEGNQWLSPLLINVMKLRTEALKSMLEKGRPLNLGEVLTLAEQAGVPKRMALKMRLSQIVLSSNPITAGAILLSALIFIVSLIITVVTEPSMVPMSTIDALTPTFDRLNQ